jgi:hypothetical protein
MRLELKHVDDQVYARIGANREIVVSASGDIKLVIEPDKEEIVAFVKGGDHIVIGKSRKERILVIRNRDTVPFTVYVSEA